MSCRSIGVASWLAASIGTYCSRNRDGNRKWRRGEGKKRKSRSEGRKRKDNGKKRRSLGGNRRRKKRRKGTGLFLTVLVTWLAPSSESAKVYD